MSRWFESGRPTFRPAAANRTIGRRKRKRAKPAFANPAHKKKSWRRPTFPHRYQCSIIGPAGLNYRVRDGNGCDPRGVATRKLVRPKFNNRKSAGPPQSTVARRQLNVGWQPPILLGAPLFHSCRHAPGISRRAKQANPGGMLRCAQHDTLRERRFGKVLWSSRTGD